MQRTRRPAESWTYIPRDDRALPPDQQTRITLRPLTLQERMRAIDDQSWVTEDPATGVRSVARRAWQEAFRLATDFIEAVENFPAGAPEPWPAGRKERQAYLEGMGEDVILEIGNEIINHSMMEPEAKN